MDFKASPNTKYLGFCGNLLACSKQSDLELKGAHGNVLVTESSGCVTPGKEVEVPVCACGEMLQP